MEKLTDSRPSLVPVSCGGKRVWYTLFAHVPLPKNLSDSNTTVYYSTGIYVQAGFHKRTLKCFNFELCVHTL